MAFDALARENYISLTTFRRNGRAVATPVQFVIDGERLLVYTKATTGKVTLALLGGEARSGRARSTSEATCDPLLLGKGAWL